MKHIFFVSVFVAMVISGCATTTIIDFEDLSSVTTKSPTPTPVNPGDSFTVGATLIDNSSGVEIKVLPFQWTNKNWTDKGYVEIVSDNKAGGSGNEIHFNNACLGIISPKAKTIKKITTKFGDYGGNINLIENGFMRNYEDFALIPSPTSTGLKVIVTPGLPLGTIKLSGDMDKFYYAFPVPPLFPVSKYSAVLGGGQELWIDDIEFSQ